jgi:hypothetical protein
MHNVQNSTWLASVTVYHMECDIVEDCDIINAKYSKIRQLVEILSYDY